MHVIEGALSHHFADLAKIAERTAHADKLRFGVDILQPFDTFQLFGEKFLDLRRLFFGGKPVARKQLRQRYGAERKGFVIQKIFSVILHDLRTAAADLENDPLGDIHRVDNALIDVHRLFFRREHAKFDAAGRGDFFQETSLVFRTSDRSRRNGDNFLDPVGIAKFAEHFQRFHRFRNALRL